MSILFGGGLERRSASPENWGIPGPGEAEGGYGRVDLRRAEASLQKTAVWACVALARSITETLPLDVLTGTGAAKREVPMPSWLADLGGDGHGLPDWCSQVVYSEMLRGNAIGVVADRDRTGVPRQVVLQHPDTVRVRREYGRSGPPVWTVAGQEVARGDIWHKRVHSVPGQIMGLSPIEMQALTIGVGIAALRFGKQWFEDGAHPSGLLTTTQHLSKEKAATAKSRFLAALAGRREPVVLGGAWKFDAIQIKPNESQFLETHRFTGAECCRIFGPALAEVLGYETGGSMTYATIEQRSIDLLVYSIDPWLVRLERMLTALLPPGQYAKYNRGALLRTDLLTRFRAHALALQNGFEVINEVREHEDLKAVPWGDTPLEGAPGPKTPSTSPDGGTT